MTIYKKPDLKVFGANAKPTEIAEFEDLLRGWGITIEKTNGIPPMEWFNYLFNRLDGNINYILQNGITEYDANLEYPQNAVAKSNGKLYLCLRQNTNKPLSNGAYWELLIKNATTSQSGIVQLSSSVTSTDETKASTPKATKTAFDKAVQADNNANTRFSKSGGQITGDTYVVKDSPCLGVKNREDVGRLTIVNRDFIYQTYKDGQFANHKFPHKPGTILLDTDKSSSTTSTSEDTIATSLAVKKVNDKTEKNLSSIIELTRNKYSKTGGDLSGDLYVSKQTPIIGIRDVDGTMARLVRVRNILMFQINENGYWREIHMPKKSGVFALEENSVLVGSIHKFASDKPQKGYLKCDGGLYSTTTYADLFAEIGYTWGGSGNKFAVPKVTDKNRFFRSDGNGLKVGTYQNDAIRDIQGFIPVEVADGNIGGCFNDTKMTVTGSGAGGGSDKKVEFKASNVVPTADENRPYACVVAYWIKY